MNTLVFESKLIDLPGFVADAVLGDTVFEVLLDPRDIRRIRASVLDIARISASNHHRRGILILDEPQISDDRLREEWKSIQVLFRPAIFDRMTLVIRHDGTLGQVMGPVSDEERDSIETVAERARQQSSRSMRRPSEAFFDILRVLLIHWIRKSGPLTSKQLGEQAGFTYPTVANALEQLDAHLNRHSDRRVELNSFPKDAWFKLVAQSEKIRVSQGYTDRSGRPRPPEVMLNRLGELGRDDIAVGGVLGARHYLPGLDMIGSPRLDLVMDKARLFRGRIGKSVEPVAILRKLDPALTPAERGEPFQVVVHSLFRPEPFFSPPQDGIRWADEVECLLDLHDARLESQALEFLERITPGLK